MRRGPRPRVVLLVALALALVTGGWLWFRDSSFVAAHGVQISGVQGPGAGAIEAALRERASGMSTLDVNLGSLRAAVAAYPQVRDLRVHASFPHGMRITVIEQPPVAVLQATDGAHTAAAADGAILGAGLASSSLPVVGVASVPAKQVQSPATLECLEVLGAVPTPLASFLVRAYDGPKGLTVQLRNGMLVIFGNASRPHAKWISFARVLVAEGGASASYVDVRLPERPAVGRAAPPAPRLPRRARPPAARARQPRVRSEAPRRSSRASRRRSAEKGARRAPAGSPRGPRANRRAPPPNRRPPNIRAPPKGPRAPPVRALRKAQRAPPNRRRPSSQGG